jgi:hypothetical protein
MQTKEVKFVDTVLDVPYLSQYKDIKDGEHRVRACGMTCVYMVLKHFGANIPSIDDMIEVGVRNNGYGPSGWIHDYFVGLFNELGYKCERQEKMSDRDVEAMRKWIKQGSPVIVSVVRRLWDQRIFHMVLLVGVRENGSGELSGFFYHDPASLKPEGSKNMYVPLNTFFLDWRHMAIFPRKP